MERPPKESYLQPGTVIDGKYEVRRVLGAGAMGAVVEATHLLRRARVALKFMSQGMADRPGVVERFLNEGVAASRINNDHVVKVLDVSRLPNGQPYLVMEFLEGEDLANLLTREGAHGLADPRRAVHFILQVLRGLQVAHQVGIIHRDLKPANCFVVAHDGEPDFIKLVDFGISKVQESDTTLALTSEGATMGTPLYVSPEQARDATSVDARSDVYSVSAMLYELLCGRTPFDSPTLAGLFMQLATATPTPLDTLRPDLPPGLAEVVQKGLAKLPEERYQSAVEMAWALAPFADARSEVVLRQLVQRSSVHAGRLSSSQPPGSQSSPPLYGSEAMIPRAPLPPRLAGTGNPIGVESRGTAPGVVRVSGKEASEARSASPKSPGSRGLRVALVPLLLVAVAGVGAAYVAVSGSRDDKVRAAGGDAEASENTLSELGRAPPAAEGPRTADSPVGTAEPPTASGSAPAERPPDVSVVTPPPPAPRTTTARPLVAPSAAAGAGASSPTPTTASGGAASSAHQGKKPSLNKIGLQD